MRALADALTKAGVQVDWFRYGPGPGQGRVQMRADAALQLADRVLLYRHLAVNVARAKGLKASFLPLATEGGATPGFPVHLALWKDGRNLFHNDAGWSLTSAVARGCAGGLLAHLPALSALCAPTTNSYRRLVSGVSGPAGALLSTTDRKAACRIPARSTAPGARRVKFCVPDSTCNPYLAIAAIVMAALDGVEKMMEPPVDGEAPAPGGVPHCLESALDALGSDRAFLTAGEVFSPAILDAWTRERWASQVIPTRTKPHPAETAEDPKEA
ncbi:MAG: glutamine synthetase [Elusimicrobiota bacterium]|nr:MAG: glutamine synthetase [Elusimicrobiota bacterium]